MRPSSGRRPRGAPRSRWTSRNTSPAPSRCRTRSSPSTPARPDLPSNLFAPKFLLQCQCGTSAPPPHRACWTRHFDQRCRDIQYHKMERNHLLNLYFRMLLIRRFEERTAEMYALGKIGGVFHLYIRGGGGGLGGADVLPRGDAVCSRPPRDRRL